MILPSNLSLNLNLWSINLHIRIIVNCSKLFERTPRCEHEIIFSSMLRALSWHEICFWPHFLFILDSFPEFIEKKIYHVQTVPNCVTKIARYPRYRSYSKLYEKRNDGLHYHWNGYRFHNKQTSSMSMGLLESARLFDLYIQLRPSTSTERFWPEVLGFSFISPIQCFSLESWGWNSHIKNTIDLRCIIMIMFHTYK